MNPELIARCREILIAVSWKGPGSTIHYGELAAEIGVASQAAGKYLNAVYNDLVLIQKLPDLTLLAVRSGSNYGRFNSCGGTAQSVVFDSTDPEQCRLYDEARELVYRHWS